MTADRGLPPLLTPGEVAALFRVDPKTVTRWGSSGRLPSIRTPGGHRRFPRDQVLELLEQPADPAATCSLCRVNPAALGSKMCAGCGEAHAYYANLTPEERREEHAAIAAYVDEPRDAP